MMNGKGGDGGAYAIGRFLDVGDERSAGSDFDENARAAEGGHLDAFHEMDWLANIAPPIMRVEFSAREHLGVYSRYERNLGPL